ncbi:hypothetical protein M1146_04255 [Patescibacteria group bacterium]|nr:hypothetical protein [Patescibacteria group bacterium]
MKKRARLEQKTIRKAEKRKKRKIGEEGSSVAVDVEERVNEETTLARETTQGDIID